MSTAPRKKVTAAEYLAFDRDSDGRHEFLDGEIHAMAGASRPHNRLTENLSVEIGGRLREGPCQTFSSGLRVLVERTGLYTYPDFIIVCEEPDIRKIEGVDTLLNPVVVVEITSPTTERDDRGRKFLNYRRLPSLREYVRISQDEVLIERYGRQPDESWSLTTFDDPAGEFALESVPVRVPIADVYRRVVFPEHTQDPR